MFNSLITKQVIDFDIIWDEADTDQTFSVEDVDQHEDYVLENMSDDK